MATEPITNNSEYARIEQRRRMVRQMSQSTSGTSSVYTQGANNRYGPQGRIQSPAQQNNVSANPFARDVNVFGNPFGGIAPLQQKRQAPPVDFGTLTPEQLIRLDATQDRTPQNAVQARLFRLAGVGQEQGTPLTGQFADARIDTRNLAINRGVQVQDIVSQVQGRLLNPQLQEMIRGLWQPNLPQVTRAQEANEGFQKWAVDFQNVFSQVGDATQRQGGSMFAGMSFGGGGNTGGESSGGMGGDPQESRRGFRWNG